MLTSGIEPLLLADAQPPKSEEKKTHDSITLFSLKAAAKIP
jgi:hypothetical protein